MAASPLSPAARLKRRIAIEQVEALFGTVTVGVCGAATAAAVLAATLYHLGALAAWMGVAWTSYVVACAIIHIVLCHFYRRSRPVDDRWAVWARIFTVIAFAEGMGWGWAQIGLSMEGHVDGAHLELLVMAGVVAGAIPAFSPYMPAFLAILLPSTVPALFASLVSTDPVQHAGFLLVVLWMAVVGALGVKANLSFKQLVGLRIQTEELAEDLQRQKEIAERANMAKSTFLAAASHDLRQPVHALSLFVGALHGIAMAPEGRRIVEQIEASTNAMDGLFTALLDISRLDAGAVEVHRRPFAIGALLDRICRDHAEEARLKGLSFVWKPCAILVESDPMLVERILRNLVANAVRYTVQGRILVGCRRHSAAIAVQVWDTGPGIALDQHDCVFQEYYQLANPERDRAKGLGLGLAIVRRLTDLLGCRLTLRSQPGRGSCFEVSVPLAAGTAVAADPASAVQSGGPVQGFVVVIDDERAIRDAMTVLLRGWGYDVVASGSGNEAVESLATCPVQPNLIICDYRLRDGENGIDVVERLRLEYNESIPAMLITGDTAPNRLIEAQASGLLLLHKPVSNGQLRTAIVNLIATADVRDMAERELTEVR